MLVNGLVYLVLDCRKVKTACNIFYAFHRLRRVRHISLITPQDGTSFHLDYIALQLFRKPCEVESLCIDVRHCDPVARTDVLLNALPPPPSSLRLRVLV